MATDFSATVVTEILQDTLPHLPGAVREVADRELRRVIREFYERSYAWRDTVTGLDVSAGDDPVAVSGASVLGDSASEAIAILDVRFKNRVVPKISFRPADADSTTQSDQPTAWYMADSQLDSFYFYPYFANAVTGEVDVTIAKTPLLTAVTWPEQLITQQHDVIVSGLLSKMLMHPNKPYTDTKTASYHASKFRAGISHYASRAKQGYNNSPAWSYPRSWNVRRLGGNG